MSTKIIAIRIRGNVGIRGTIQDTMTMLNLKNQHNCVVLDNTPSVLGMLKKVQGYVTWGIADEETLALLKPLIKDKIARLQPPLKGFERKGIKVSFVQGGALGNRKDKINELVKRMVRA